MPDVTGQRFLAVLNVIRQLGNDEQPEHPIVLPPEPPQFPVFPSHPIFLPGLTPGHPIVLPPEPMPPDYPLFPAHPIELPIRPEHPIVIPPDEPTTPDTPAGNWGWVYIPGEGWRQAWFPVIPTPGPSR